MSDSVIEPPDQLLERRHSRRRFLELGTTVLGATLLSSGAFAAEKPAVSDPAPGEGGPEAAGSPSTAASAEHGADALLLSCMDFRLVNEVNFFMTERAMTNRFDHVILAGATLGVATDKFPAWAETFWTHLELAVELHEVKRVIAIDHRDCGAYKLALGQDFGATPDAETEIHTRVMRDFGRSVKERHPNLDVEMFLMSLDGQVEVIA